jgi:hypothetical protein
MYLFFDMETTGVPGERAAVLTPSSGTAPKGQIRTFGDGAAASYAHAIGFALAACQRRFEFQLRSSPIPRINPRQQTPPAPHKQQQRAHQKLPAK